MIISICALENDITSLCRLMVSFIMTCHYPLQLNPYRKSLLSLLNSFCGPVEDCDGSFRCRYFSVTVQREFLKRNMLPIMIFFKGAYFGFHIYGFDVGG